MIQHFPKVAYTKLTKNFLFNWHNPIQNSFEIQSLDNFLICLSIEASYSGERQSLTTFSNSLYTEAFRLLNATNSLHHQPSSNIDSFLSIFLYFISIPLLSLWNLKPFRTTNFSSNVSIRQQQQQQQQILHDLSDPSHPCSTRWGRWWWRCWGLFISAC